MDDSALIFDFDGTLVDSIDATREASNEALREFGADPVSTRGIIEGMRFEPRQRFGVHSGMEDPHTLARMGKRFYEIMYNRVGRIHFAPGIVEVLSRFTANGHTLGVYSSNRGATIRRFLRANEVDTLFSVVLGDGDDIPLKPSGEGLKLIARQLGVSVSRMAYIGDGESDAIAAERAGCFSVGVSWVTAKYDFEISSRFPRVASTVPELVEILGRWTISSPG